MLTELQFLPRAYVEYYLSPAHELLMVIAQLLTTDRYQITIVTLIPILYSQ